MTNKRRGQNRDTLQSELLEARRNFANARESEQQLRTELQRTTKRLEELEEQIARSEADATGTILAFAQESHKLYNEAVSHFHGVAGIFNASRTQHSETVSSNVLEGEALQIIGRYTGAELTCLPPDVGSALMKSLAWLCVEEPAYTCMSCSKVLTRPPVNSVAIQHAADRLQSLTGTNESIAGNSEPLETPDEDRWRKFFPQDSMLRALFSQRSSA
ncbi:hypothetical protein NM688_g4731 [Phlebia brevispora]|uniref:Uncharacterized protein n=1 Tax=Phlebia brevispora TaxID=194682 RepID=A0ACC1T2Q6_9APHY|nr:hypothetical protein NM688_g4731 [Phlebia brevispora]